VGQELLQELAVAQRHRRGAAEQVADVVQEGIRIAFRHARGLRVAVRLPYYTRRRPRGDSVFGRIHGHPRSASRGSSPWVWPCGGFSEGNLRQMRAFYLGWTIRQTPSAKLGAQAATGEEPSSVVALPSSRDPPAHPRPSSV